VEQNKRSLFLIIIVVFLLIPGKKTYAQCFASPGNPIAGSTNVGVLQNRITRVLVFHKFSYSNQYFEGSNKISYDYPAAISNANFNYSGFSVGYGLRKRITLEVEAGYFFNKTQNYRHFDYKIKGYGFSNAVFTGKFNIYKNVDKMLEFTMSGGLKVPFSLKPQVVNGVTLPIDIQPSTGNFGSIFQALFVKEFKNISARFILFSRYENNFNENRMGYRFGDAYTTSIFLSKHLANRYTEITKDITVILQIRHEYKFSNLLNDKPVVASGSNSLYLGPQINYNLNMVWNFSLIYDFPIYHYYNDIQLGNSYSVLLSITRDLGYRI
jgi:hypothetical protein